MFSKKKKYIYIYRTYKKKERECSGENWIYRLLKD